MVASGGHINRKSWRWIAATAALVTVVLCLLVFRWRHEGFDWGVFAASFRQLKWQWLLASALFTLATYYGRALRWAVMIKPLRPQPSVWGLFSATVIGFTAIVIFGRPGEFVRPYLISIKERVPFSSQLAAWLLERIYDLLTALLIFGFALAQVDRSGAKIGPGLQWVFKVGGHAVGLTCLICLLVLLLLRQFSDQMRRRLLEALAFLPSRHYQRAEELVTSFVRGVEATKDGSALLMICIYTFFEWALIAGCYFCLFRSFPDLGGLHLTDVLIFLGFVSFGCIVQVPGVGGGMQLVSIVVLNELFGLPLELAGSVAIMVWALAVIVVVPLGVALLFHEGLSWQKLKEIEVEASV
jgi:uncharacterized protein (TIRG00374 family)